MKSRPAGGSSPSREAFAVTKGSVVVRGYPLSSGLWQLSWYAPDGARQRKAFRVEAEARRYATSKASELAGQRSLVRSLTVAETADYEEAIGKLPPGVRLTTAVNFYLERHPVGARRAKVSEVVAELLADLKERGLSAAYQRSADYNLNRMASDLNCAIADVTPEIFRAWIRGLEVAPKTQQGVRGLAVKLFNFAVSRRLLSREHALELAEVETAKAVVTSIHTLNPKGVRAMLESASDEERPTVVLLAFLPLRTAEVARMDWRDLRISERVLVVNASVAKVAVRRVIPIPPAAIAWISGWVKRSGPIAPDQPDPTGNRLAHRLPKIATAAGVDYRKNCLRHSCISALMATEQGAARVSLWAGNSPRIVSTNYSARWTKAEGEAWFRVMP